MKSFTIFLRGMRVTCDVWNLQLSSLWPLQNILIITNRTLFHMVGLTRRVQIRLMDLLGLQATIKSLKVGPFKDNHKSSTNRYTQMRHQPKCQFRDQRGHIAKSCPRLHCSEVTTNCATTSSPQDQKLLENKPLFNINDQ